MLCVVRQENDVCKIKAFHFVSDSRLFLFSAHLPSVVPKMIHNLSYVLKLYKNPVDAKSTLIKSSSIACLEMFFSFPIIKAPSGISPSVYNPLSFLLKHPANTRKATVSVCSSILLANSVWSLDESKLCQLTKPQFEYDEIVPPILKSACWQELELFLILAARS